MAASEPKSIFTCGGQSGLSFEGRVEGAFKPPPAERRASAGKPAGQLKNLRNRSQKVGFWNSEKGRE